MIFSLKILKNYINDVIFGAGDILSPDSIIFMKGYYNMDLTSPRTIRNIQEQFGFTFKKGLGQNFLTARNILEEIVANKRIEVEQAKLLVSLDELKKATDSAPPVRSLRKSIESHHEGGIIAEFKRRSPSKDWINRHGTIP